MFYIFTKKDFPNKKKLKKIVCKDNERLKKYFTNSYRILEYTEVIINEKLNPELNEIYENKNLSWGAKLSFYKDELEKYKNDESITIYGIELEKDIEISNDYIEIDHHGKNDDKPSSLEQIAKILNIDLTKEQRSFIRDWTKVRPK